jgi:uncharacterized repeat protein (TIGR03803 family)
VYTSGCDFKPSLVTEGTVHKLNWWKSACAASVLCVTAAITLQAQTFNTLVYFNGADGSYATASLVQGPDGAFYGTTTSGGTNGAGNVFRMTAQGELTTLYSFCSQPNCADGVSPWAGLTLGTDGNFYGTTWGGGTVRCTHGCGTVFKITPGGALTTLHTFVGTDGQYPYAGLAEGLDGNFYGATEINGAHGWGTIFKITPDGKLTTLYSFCSQPNCADGASPWGALALGPGGDFYGTTVSGGREPGDGTVFRVTPEGVLTTLHKFCVLTNCADGAYPRVGLVLGPDGNFYGTTASGGANQYYGTVFKIDRAGELTTLYSFCSQPDCRDGNVPYAALALGTDGNFYGTTYEGGDYGWGTVFNVTPGGTLTTLHSFDHSDGNYPDGGLFQGTNGIFYGATSQGAPSNNGTIYSLMMGLSPFIEAVPAAGRVGTPVLILGAGLIGASSVTFNGAAASFTVESASAIRTNVPTGATSGPIQVVTPGGTLTSNVSFQVEP